jgi:ferritin-like metal-binding protein YciE
MASTESLTELLVNEIRDLYDAEKRLTKAIPKLSSKASNPDLRKAMDAHLKETRGQVRRLEQVFRHMGESPRGKPCAGMRGIIEEGNEHAGEEYADDSLRDLMIVGSASRVEHYEMAAYMSAISHARTLGLRDVRKLLEESLSEEQAADRKLMTIAERQINETASRSGSGTVDEDGMVTGFFKRVMTPARQSRGRARARKRSAKKR